MVNEQSVNAVSHSPAVLDWLTNPRHPVIEHVFERVCNLVNEHRDILSIVTPQVGNGPFNLVIYEELDFPKHINAGSPVSFSDRQVCLGGLTINITGSQLWNPRPDWESLHANRTTIPSRLVQLDLMKLSHSVSIGLPGTTPDQSLLSCLSDAAAHADIPSVRKIAPRLAGLGSGLTPAGDDYMVGAIYASWILHPPEIAGTLGKEIADRTSPLTTSLSAAWLKSAGRGEAGILWHLLLDALLATNRARIRAGIDRILAVGETSGADALAGFLNTLNFGQRWTEPD